VTGVLGDLLRRILFGTPGGTADRARRSPEGLRPEGDARLRDIGRRVKEQLRGTARSYDDYDVDEDRGRSRQNETKEDDGE
jgi:hypothetical protein